MSLALRYARRELRAGTSGFRVFLACVALGVAAIAAAGSTAETFRRGLAAEAREILGGDLAVSIQGRRFTPAEQAAFARLGRTTDTFRIRAMAQAPSGARRLSEVRGVDAAYPLSGAVTVTGAPSLAAALAGDGAAVEQALLDRLGLKLGQAFVIGDAPFTVRAVLDEEPDRLAGGFGLGPRVLVSRASMEAARLVEADALFGETVRIALPDERTVAGAERALRQAFPRAGLRIRDRNDAAGGLRRLIDQLEYFLGFIGLASLLAGGLGVNGAVSSYLEARKPSIAVLKALGAQGSTIRDLFLIRIAVLSAVGIVIGLLIGAATPMLLGWLLRDSLTIPALFGLYPAPLAKAALFGALAAAAFSLLPLARARATPPSSLFRRDLTGRLHPGPEAFGAVLAGGGLAWVSVATAPTPPVAAGMVGGVAAAYGLLWLLGRGAARTAARLRGLTHGPVRMGLANLAGPASAARTVSPSIGLGVALLTVVLILQSTLLAQVREAAPNNAPAMVFTQIRADQAAAFDQAAARVMGPLTPDNFRRMPFATGRIVGVGGQPVRRDRIAPEGRWAFDQDIGMSAIGPAPPDAHVTAGSWWPADYAGPPRLMMNEEIAKAAGLKPGDRVTLSVLGRELEATISGLRKVEFGGFGANFALILDPSALEGAALTQVAVVKTDKAGSIRLDRALGRGFANVNVFNVREQLEAAGKLLDQLAWGVRGAAAVVAAAGLLVLVGATAATAERRRREGAILKVLGATRGQALTASVVEYGAVGVIAAATGVLLGTLAAWPVVVLAFHFAWRFDWAVLTVLAPLTAGLTALGGALAALPALAQRPAPVLRRE
ncbi:MAG TPA: FtsX-like permease family protein [Caulobacteraceae bacterium]|jgi:putative ABC transport system permease protein|nr:FtsX-like permease family protein [Caulobacteraceae bacterium]